MKRIVPSKKIKKRFGVGGSKGGPFKAGARLDPSQVEDRRGGREGYSSNTGRSSGGSSKSRKRR